MASKDALVMVFSRNAFYRKLHFLAFAALMLSLIVIFCLVSIFIYLMWNPKKPLYFAADEVGRLIQIVPVNIPNMSEADTIEWAKEAVVASFSYDYIKYRGQLQKAQKYFTNLGWSNYMDALNRSGNLRALTVRKQVILADVVEKPVILREGILAGAYAWEFSMPLLVLYAMPPYDGSNQFSNSVQVSVVVQRQPILAGYKGLGIVRLISNLASSSEQTNEMLVTPGAP